MEKIADIFFNNFRLLRGTKTLPNTRCLIDIMHNRHLHMKNLVIFGIRETLVHIFQTVELKRKIDLQRLWCTLLCSIDDHVKVSPSRTNLAASVFHLKYFEEGARQC